MLHAVSKSSTVWTSTDAVSVSTTLLRTVLTRRRPVNTWAIVARLVVTPIMEEEEEEEEETHTATRTVTGTTAVATATATLTDVTTTETPGIGANVVAHPRPEAADILPTDGAGATPGALQEAAAPAEIMRHLLRRRWQLPPPTPAGKLPQAPSIVVIAIGQRAIK